MDVGDNARLSRASTPPDRPGDAGPRPAHYGGADNLYETIKVLRAWMRPEEFEGFCAGNALKYLSRWRSKGGVEDLRKARVYLDWLIDASEVKA